MVHGRLLQRTRMPMCGWSVSIPGVATVNAVIPMSFAWSAKTPAM